MRSEGVVKKLARTGKGGYGFIRDLKTGEEIFFLPSALSRNMHAFEMLNEGDLVEYDGVIKDSKGHKAQTVIKVGDARPDVSL